jgi:hypothetical protein
MRIALALAVVGIFAALAVRLHRCKCGSHKRKDAPAGQLTFIPTSYGGFYTRTVRENCADCGHDHGLRTDTWNAAPSDIVALFI